MTDRHARALEDQWATVIRGPGETAPELRSAAAANAELPAELVALVDKIHRHADQVTDGDVAALRARYSDDELFEIIVAAALGAARRRLAAGLRALEAAR